ncbi:MAG: hypothetical protein QME75_15220 [Deltaproteobacteria bacterium]|nr:hypothetical protein [Deltaproteobacteria bacterium]
MNKMSKIEKDVKEMLETIAKTKLSKDPWPTYGSLTKTIKNKLCKLGKDFGFSICGHKNEWPGWLFDVTWLKYSGDYLVEVPLILECEWNPDDDEIYDDFYKLVIGKATHRVMIFEKRGEEEIKRVMDTFEKMVRKYKFTEIGDRYLFAGLNWNTGIFDFRLFIVD